MVRTRATRGKPGSQDSAASKESQDSAYCSPSSDEKSKKVLLCDVKRQADLKLCKLDETLRCLIGDIEKRYAMIKMSIGPVYGNMLLSDFMKEEISPPDEQEDESSFLKPKTVPSSLKGFATSTARKTRESPPSPQVTRVTRQSRKRSGLARSISEDNLSAIFSEEVITTKKKPARRTRSASNDRQTQIIAKSIYETPASKNRTMLAVTPKADPATAALKRHPRTGEFALSLTGSPLMIPQGCNETNITLPLGNGEVYSILPTDNFVAGQIPALSESTRKQILMLRKNLDRLLKK